MDKALKHRINAGRVAVRNQVEFFHRQFGHVSSEWKEDDTRVTFVDFAISEKIFAELRRSFPRDDFCSEESNPQDEVLSLTGKYAWVLDPVDGTNNYALGLPICAISLALLKNGTPVYGFVYDLSRRRLIEGGPGIGLFDGDRRVAARTDPMGSQSVIGMHFPLGEREASALIPLLSSYRVRTIGSGALVLAYAAAGVIDGCIDFRVKVWDIAAGYAFILASGGRFHFVDPPVFPMREFHVRQDPVPYFAGSQAFCEAIQALGLE